MFVAKGNHPGMFEILTEWAEREIARPADHADEPGRPAHGRLEKREIRVSTGPLHMIAFPWAGQVFAVRRTVRQYRCAKAGRPATVGRPSVEIVVGITSHTAMSADAEQLLSAESRALDHRGHAPGSRRADRLERGPFEDQKRPRPRKLVLPAGASPSA